MRCAVAGRIQSDGNETRAGSRFLMRAACVAIHVEQLTARLTVSSRLVM